MSVSAVTNKSRALLCQSRQLPASVDESDSANAETALSPAPSLAVTASVSTEALPTKSSIEVTLSPEAQVFARLNALGMTETLTSLTGLNLPARGRDETPSDWAQKIAQALRKFEATSAPVSDDGRYDGYISRSALETVVERFGGDKRQSDLLYAALGAGATIAHAQLLDALAGTAGSSTSSTARALLELMDGDGDGLVIDSEYIDFETALVAVEKRGN
ncbi:hypothetical protein OH764_32535 (plasmid) [Burkholderia sp. M6-3]